jgi:ribosomal protein S18 acetylase RimI-like enzyme
MIRDLKKSDADDLLRFLTDYFPEENAILGFRPDGFYRVIARVFRWDLRIVLGLLRLFGRRIFRFLVIEEDGHVVATTLVTLPPRAAYISTVAVDPAYRRRGLARALLEEARTTGRKAGRTYVALDVLAENTPARTLYDALGYRPLRENRFMVCETAPTGPPPAVPGLRPFDRRDTKALLEIGRRAQPPQVAEVLPLSQQRFNTAGAIDRALNSASSQWVIDRGRGPEAYIDASVSPATNAASLNAPVLADGVDPATAIALVRTAIAWCYGQGGQKVVAQVPVASARERAALEGAGFRDALAVWTLYRTIA